MKHQYVCVSYLIHQSLPITFASSGRIHFGSENILLNKYVNNDNYHVLCIYCEEDDTITCFDIMDIISGWDGQLYGSACPFKDAIHVVTAAKAKEYHVGNVDFYLCDQCFYGFN